jgi:hypothetical protein
MAMTSEYLNTPAAKNGVPVISRQFITELSTMAPLRWRLKEFIRRESFFFRSFDSIWLKLLITVTVKKRNIRTNAFPFISF